jgi:hypothetical protein
VLVVAGLEVREFLLLWFEVVPEFNNFRASQFGDLRFSGPGPNAIRQQRKVNKDYNPVVCSSRNFIIHPYNPYDRFNIKLKD